MTGERTIRGVGVSPGLAYAPAVVLEWKFPVVPDRWVSAEEVEGEVHRLDEAVASVVHSLNRLRERVLERAGLEESQIFEAQIMMVQDAEFLKEVVHLIRDTEARRAIEAAARRLVVERYDWSAVAMDFEEALLRVSSGRAGERAIA